MQAQTFFKRHLQGNERQPPGYVSYLWLNAVATSFFSSSPSQLSAYYYKVRRRGLLADRRSDLTAAIFKLLSRTDDVQSLSAGLGRLVAAWRSSCSWAGIGIGPAAVGGCGPASRRRVSYRVRLYVRRASAFSVLFELHLCTLGLHPLDAPIADAGVRLAVKQAISVLAGHSLSR